MHGRKWLVVTDDYPPTIGGIATWTSHAVDALASTGPVVVYTRQRPGLACRPGVDVNGVRTRSFARRGALALALAARRDLRHARGVLCTTWAVGRFLSRLAPVHVVAHGTDVDLPDVTRGFDGTWRRAAGRWAVSVDLVRRLEARGVRAQRLPLPLPKVPLATGGDRFVLNTRCVAGKGGKRFLRLVVACGVSADVIGDGPLRVSWERLAIDLGADVTFHGSLAQKRVPGVLDAAAAVFQLSAAPEGLGLSLIEARARGIPVVACSHSGLREAAGNGLLLGKESPQDAQTVMEWLAAEPRGVWLSEREGFLDALGAR